MSAPIRLSDEQAGRGKYEAAIIARYAEARQRLTRPMPKLVPPTPNSPYGSMVDLHTSPSWKLIVSLVALKHGCSVNDIIGKDNRRDISAARHEAVALVYRHCNLSLMALGRLFKRDHTTAMNSIRKFYGKRMNSLSVADVIQPVVREPVDFLSAPNWRFLVHLCAMQRGVPVEKLLKAGSRARRQTRNLIAEHCGYAPQSVGFLLTNWGKI